MAEISIDQSKLPGVKEVCRDFAVLEDHTLAHSLQEQEIEHHLATNVQRNRLVQYDLQMAKQLQEEEDHKARARIQERHKDLERQDCEIAQEIQVKLVIEAEQRRRQEEDDEDIARILQQKELQEEKRRKKLHPEPLQKSTYEEGYYPESRDRSCGSPREQARPRPARSPREPRRGPPLFSEGLDLEVLGSSSEVRQAGGGQRDSRERQDRKRGGRERPRRPPSDTEECGHWDGGRSNQRREASSQERPWRPSSLALDGEVERPGGSSMGQREWRPRNREGRHRTPPLPLDREDAGARLDGSSRPRKHRERRSPSSERTPRPPYLSADVEERHRYDHSWSPDPDRQRQPAPQDQESPRPPSRDPRLQDPEAPAPQRGRRRDGARDRCNEASASPSSHSREDGGADARRRKDPGTKLRGTKEATYHKSRPAAPQDQESYDAEIARKLQEEELLASQVDKRAAQVAQDEEIARLLLAEEKKVYRKAKEREKSSLEKKRQEPDWKHDTHDMVRPRSREGHEGHRSRSDKPTRPPPPPSEDLDHLCNLTSQHNVAHQTPSHKGYHYKH